MGKAITPPVGLGRARPPNAFWCNSQPQICKSVKVLPTCTKRPCNILWLFPECRSFPYCKLLQWVRGFLPWKNFKKSPMAVGEFWCIYGKKITLDSKDICSDKFGTYELLGAWPACPHLCVRHSHDLANFHTSWKSTHIFFEFSC